MAVERPIRNLREGAMFSLSFSISSVLRIGKSNTGSYRSFGNEFATIVPGPALFRISDSLAGQDQLIG